MVWLAAHMWFLLVTAFAIGIGVGWWMWGGDKADTKPAAGNLETEQGTLRQDFAPTAEQGDLNA